VKIHLLFGYERLEYLYSKTVASFWNLVFLVNSIMSMVQLDSSWIPMMS